jgi:hypothetical protein
MLRLILSPRGSGRTAVLFGDEELAVGHGAVVCQAARRLIERGHDPGVRLEVWRGSTLCLAGTIGGFARLIVEECADGVARFRKWHPRPSEGSSPIRYLEATLSPNGSGDDALYEADQDA